MTEKSIFIEFLGDRPIVRILDFLMEKRPFIITKNEIIEESGVSRNSLYKFWKVLEDFGIVVVIKKVRGVKLYALNDESEIVQKILDLELSLVKRELEKEELEPIAV